MDVIIILVVSFLVLYVLWVASFIFIERRSPISTISWLLVFILLPYLGFILYFFFGRDMSKKKVFKLYREEKETMREIQNQQQKESVQFALGESQLDEEMLEVVRLNKRLSQSSITFDNETTFLTDGKEMFDSFIKDLKSAKKEINMLFFIYKKGDLGRQIRDVLVQKAKEGVVVRVLLDDLGGRHVKHGFFNVLKKAGGEVSFSFPRGPLYINANNRNHRKITIIDRSIAYIGGFNVGDEYLGLKPKFGYWRDTHLRVVGSSIHSILMRFILDWRNAGNKDIVIDKDTFPRTISHGDTAVQIVSSGPDSKISQIKFAYMEMIHQAKESIHIQTPYFVPDQAFFEAIRMALLKGVEVTITIPNRQDHVFVYWATYSYIGDLLPLGLKAYTYDQGFLHSKMLMVDKKIVSIGSANLDERSFHLSFECNAFLYGHGIGKEYMKIYDKDLEKSTQLTLEKYNKRSLLVKIKEPICRLLSPIL